MSLVNNTLNIRVCQFFSKNFLNFYFCVFVKGSDYVRVLSVGEGLGR